MTKTVFRLYWDKDSEEKWINEMVGKGWALSNYFIGIYTFKKCEENEYIYRIDLMSSITSNIKSMDYIKLVEESGAEYVCSWFRWVFFRKKASEGEFVLYTDIDSKIKKYKEIRNLFGMVSIAEFCIGMGQLNLLLQNEYFSIVNLICTLIIFFLGFVLLYITLKTNSTIKKLMKEHSIKE